MYFDEKIAKYVHLDLFYVKDYSWSFDIFDMHIKKNIKKSPQKIGPLCRMGGGAQNFTDWSATNRFLTKLDSLRVPK